jgi:sulfhydrogenase subunit alpha
LKPRRGDYGFRGASIVTSSGDEFPIAEYRRVAREFLVDHSHAKHAALESGETYMVGALSRLHLWGDHLQGQARQACETLFPDGASHNVLFNSWAQLVEIVHAIETAIGIIDDVLALDEVASEATEYEVRAGHGIAAVEVPRGTLFHDFELDDTGIVVAANVVTPTSQNLANTEIDLRRAAQGLLGSDGAGDAELKLGLEMVVRAYDPCISCSVHVTRAEI